MSLEGVPSETLRQCGSQAILCLVMLQATRVVCAGQFEYPRRLKPR